MTGFVASSQRYEDMICRKTGAKITGSWTVDIGEQDEASACGDFRSCMLLIYDLWWLCYSMYLEELKRRTYFCYF